MSRPAAVRRTTSLLVGALTAAGLATVPALPRLSAIVAVSGNPAVLRSVAGVHVEHVMPTLHMAVVSADAQALARLTAVPGVRSVAPDDRVQLTATTDATGGAGHYASEGLGGTAGQPGAGAGVRVAVVDTGVADTAALNRASGRLVDGVDTSGVSDGLDPVTSGTFSDGYGHGTFMADAVAGGPVAGTDGTAVGVAPGATVVVVKVARPDGTTSLSNVLAGLEWVANHHDQVDVANLALSHTRPRPSYGPDPLTDAVERVRATGVTVVVAAGNTPKVVGDPGFDPFVLTVGAMDLGTGTVAPFSGSARVVGFRKPEVVASGVHVLGLLPPDSVLAQRPGTIHLGNGLYRGTGTSQATAITSGTAAILLAAHPDANPAQVTAALQCAASEVRSNAAGAGNLRTTVTLCPTRDRGRGMGEQGVDQSLPGDGSFDASSWGASSWGASSWGASSWGASSWGASSWGASSWGASSWGASSWGASSWGASSWGASSWGASSWGASSWGASSWGASSWGASSWASDDWGTDSLLDGPR